MKSLQNFPSNIKAPYLLNSCHGEELNPYKKARFSIVAPRSFYDKINNDDHVNKYFETKRLKFTIITKVKDEISKKFK